jgi:hypothetical protein
LALALLALGPAQALAQDQAANQAYFNPEPAETDLIMPMPCGLSMVFKAVTIPAAGYLGDVELRQGVLGENGKGFVDRPFQAPLAAPLKLGNFRGAMRDKIAAVMGDKTDYQIFLIGKYEVSVGQWQAVMEGCGALGPGSELPKGSVSKMDAHGFTLGYMDWLIKNQPEALPYSPDDAKYVGAIRLPTEAEWEYAARGGQAVTAEEMEKEKLFPNPDGLQLSEFAYFSTEEGPREGPKPIGGLAPNPLGLHDTAGNLGEISLDSYRISIGTRLHGSEGGSLVKGGSYLDSGAGILPGSRVEIPSYSAEGEVKPPYVGLRLAVSGPNAADRQRVQYLQAEYAKIKQIDELTQSQIQKATAGAAAAGAPDVPLTLDPGALAGLAPVDRINALLPFMESAGQRAALSALLKDFTEYNEIKAAESAEQAQSLFNSVLFAAYGLRDTSLRQNKILSQIEHERAIIVDLNVDIEERKKATVEENKAQIEQIQATITALEATIADFNVALENQFAYYKSSLQFLSRFDPTILAGVVNLSRDAYRGTDSYSQTMNNALDMTVRDIKLFLSEQDGLVTLATVVLPTTTQ